MKIKDAILRDKIQILFEGHGLNRYCSEKAAICMVMGDMYGVKTHGTIVLPSHLKRIDNGGYNLNPEFKIITETSSFAVIDADNAIGFASASYCMEYAIKKAKENGMFSVFSRHANAYGAAFCYPMMAAEEGMIGISFCNSPTAMAPIGGKDKLFGTNPLSIVVPNEKPIIIDMATSKVAKSRFLQAKREGKQLGEGWALDADGHPTTDPDKGIQGLVCPMEGFKGYGLALIIDLLAGMLAGAAYQNQVNRFYNEEGLPMNVGHVFIAIDPKKFLGEGYAVIIEGYISNIRNSNRIDETRAVAIPGDDKHIAFEKALKDGIEIDMTVVKALNIIEV